MGCLHTIRMPSSHWLNSILERSVIHPCGEGVHDLYDTANQNWNKMTGGGGGGGRRDNSWRPASLRHAGKNGFFNYPRAGGSFKPSTTGRYFLTSLLLEFHHGRAGGQNYVRQEWVVFDYSGISTYKRPLDLNESKMEEDRIEDSHRSRNVLSTSFPPSFLSFLFCFVTERLLDSEDNDTPRQRHI